METFHIEHAIAQWRSELRKHPGLEPGYIDELESHLRDCIEDLQENGASDEDAFLSAKARTLTSVEEIADEYFKARTRRSIKPPWKERMDWLGFIPPNILLAYLKQAFRSMKAARVYTWINLLGLTLGIAASITLFNYVLYEWRTDTFHTKLDRIAVATIRNGNLSLPEPYSLKYLTKVDYKRLSIVEAATNIILFKEGESQLYLENKRFNPRILIGDTSFFDVFDFKIHGHEKANVLDEPGSILLSQDLARKIFGTKDPLGMKLVFKGANLTVKGIIETPPYNSSINFDAIVSAKTKTQWDYPGFECVVFSSLEALSELNHKIKDKARWHDQFLQSTVEFLPLKDMYYNHQTIKNGWIESGNKNYEQVLVLIAILILGVSIFNYINLNAVILLKRHKELGIRKAMGAGKKELVLGLFLENLIQLSAAAMLAAGFLWFLSPQIIHFIGKDIFQDTKSNFQLLGGVTSVTLFLATLYPIIRFPRIQSMNAIKGIMPGRRSLTGRKLLMTIQFSLTTALLIISIFFYKQLNYMLNKDLGFNSHNVVSIDFLPGKIPNYSHFPDYKRDTPEEENLQTEFYQKLAKKARQVKKISQEISENPYVQSLSYGNSPLQTYKSPWKPTEYYWDFTEELEYRTVNTLPVTPNFDELFGLEIVDGRFFDETLDKDRDRKVVVNEVALKHFNLEPWAYISNPYWEADELPWKIIGVVKNYAYEHLSHGVEPLVMTYFDDRSNLELSNINLKPLMIKLEEGHEQEALTKLKELYEELNPNNDFIYTYIDEEIQTLYSRDKQVAQVYSFFTFVALFISILGLFAISSYETEMRIKEIGIRKIIGASTPQIISLLSKDFIRYVFIAMIVACPLGIIVVMKYLENFVHHTSLSMWVFIAACGIIFSVSLLTMLWHTWQAADRNPVESLRHE